jgi:hypothetical protein
MMGGMFQHDSHKIPTYIQSSWFLQALAHMKLLVVAFRHCLPDGSKRHWRRLFLATMLLVMAYELITYGWHAVCCCELWDRGVDAWCHDRNEALVTIQGPIVSAIMKTVLPFVGYGFEPTLYQAKFIYAGHKMFPYFVGYGVGLNLPVQHIISPRGEGHGGGGGGHDHHIDFATRRFDFATRACRSAALAACMWWLSHATLSYSPLQYATNSLVAMCGALLIISLVPKREVWGWSAAGRSSLMILLLHTDFWLLESELRQVWMPMLLFGARNTGFLADSLSR